MRFQARRVVLIVAAVIVVVSLAATWGYAQAFRTEPVTPRVLSGADVGFRIEGQRGGVPVGKVVVRIDGEWVAAEFGIGTRPLTAK